MELPNVSLGTAVGEVRHHVGDNLVAGVFGHVEGFTDSSDSVSSVGVSCHVLDWVSAGFFFWWGEGGGGE